MHLSRIATILVVAFLVVAAPASASTARLVPDTGEGGAEVFYTAAAGEANKVSVTLDGGKATIDDPGAGSITAQQGCANETPKRVVCDLQDSTRTLQYVIAELADGNDSFELATLNTQFAGARVTAGPGNDDLRGGPFADLLDGGVGIDELRGGGGPDALATGDTTEARDADILDGGADFDSFGGYDKRNTPVFVDLADSPTAGEAGENDVLTSVESVGGGGADDTLRGNDDANWLIGGGGNDTLVGRGSHDFLVGGDGNDDINGGPGDDEYDAGPGDDVLRLHNLPGNYDRYVSCGEGADLVTGHTEAFPAIGQDCERLDLGMGIVVPTLPRRATYTYIAMSIPCPAAFRDAKGVCGGKLAVEPRQAFLRSARTRYRTRYGAKEFRFTTASARITVPLNAAGRKMLRKPVLRFQLTLRLKETATGRIHQFEWTETLNRNFLKDRGVG